MLAINDIKTGVMHVVNLLVINEKLLSNLPQSNAPAIRNDDDIAKALSWCEERVLAINESMVLDNSKTTVTDDSKPIHARQIELASLIEVCVAICVDHMYWFIIYGLYVLMHLCVLMNIYVS